MERRLSEIARTAPAFSAVLRAYRRALVAEDAALAEGLIAWLGGQPNVAASGEAGGRGEGRPRSVWRDALPRRSADHPARQRSAGLVLVLDEAETLQRMRADTREKGLNALRQLLDELDAGRYPGLYLVVTGTAAFFDGPQGVQRLPPLAQRLHTDFATDARFDNPRAVQIRFRASTSLLSPPPARGCGTCSPNRPPTPERIRSVVDDAYLADLAHGCRRPPWWQEQASHRASISANSLLRCLTASTSFPISIRAATMRRHSIHRR